MHDSGWFAIRILVTVIFALVGFGDALALEIERGGASSSGDGFWFQAGGLSLRKGKPGVIFGMTQKPGGDRELAYVVLFKHRVMDKSRVVTSGRVNDSGGKVRVVTMTDGIEIEDQKFDLTLTLEIGAEKTTVTSEKLAVAGKALDLQKGRVFLVDFTMKEMKWHQVNAKLPENLPDPSEIEDVRTVVKRVQTELANDSDAISKFLK